MQQEGNHVLSAEQITRVSSAIAGLDERQLSWLGGYLSGLTQAPGVLHKPSAQQPAIAGSTTVLYGSQTGNGRRVAESLHRALQETGLKTTLVSMADYRTAMLKKERRLIVVISTHGNGEPPDEALAFCQFLRGDKAPRLERLEYAVLALGDRSYEHFCHTGLELDRRLKELGAAPMLGRVDCDFDYEEDAARWRESALGKIRKQTGTNGCNGAYATNGKGPVPAAAPASSVFDRKHPYFAEILHSVALTTPASEKEVLHCELALEESGMAYAPGDAIGVVAENSSASVELLLERLQQDGKSAVSVQSGQCSLRAALQRKLEISVLTQGVVNDYAKASGNRDLAKLADDPRQRAAIARDHDLTDLVTAYPGNPGAQALADALRPVAPRLYSVASSPESHPGEVHIALKQLEYMARGRTRYGMCSNYAAAAAARGAKLPVYVKPNPSFKLPRDDAAKIIMIGAGTGIVPYRGFLLHREARGLGGNTWLIFGEQRFRSSFLYQKDWQAFLKSGVLERMNVAFSRDGEGKDYVQHRILDEAEAFYAWLRQGAHVYVCGDMRRMVHDVHRTIVGVVASQGQAPRSKVKAETRAEAERWLAELAAKKRYQKDVY